MGRRPPHPLHCPLCSRPYLSYWGLTKHRLSPTSCPGTPLGALHHAASLAAQALKPPRPPSKPRPKHKLDPLPQCPKCERTYQSQWGLTLHLRDPRQCPATPEGKERFEREEREREERKRVREGGWRCGVCGRRWMGQGGYLKHLERPGGCLVPVEVDTRKAKKKKKEKEEDGWKCERCERVWKAKRGLVKHLETPGKCLLPWEIREKVRLREEGVKARKKPRVPRVKTGGLKVGCPECGEMFWSREARRVHLFRFCGGKKKKEKVDLYVKRPVTLRSWDSRLRSFGPRWEEKAEEVEKEQPEIAIDPDLL